MRFQSQAFVYKPIIFLSLDVPRSHSTWGWSSRKRMQKPGIASYRMNAVMHTLMHLSPRYFRFLWQTGVLQYTDMEANTDTLALDRELKIQVNAEEPRLPWHHVCQVNPEWILASMTGSVAAGNVRENPRCPLPWPQHWSLSGFLASGLTDCNTSAVHDQGIMDRDVWNFGCGLLDHAFF